MSQENQNEGSEKPEFDSLEEYDEEAFDRPSVTVDLIIFTIKDDDLKLLLVERESWPDEGKKALPGSFVEMDESLEEAAKRTLDEKTGLENVYLEQLYTFGEPDRDPRTRVITVGYYALVNYDDVEDIDELEEVEWHSAYNLPELAFDHKEIAEYSLDRLRAKLEYSTAAYSFLPEKFTLSDFQNIYEVVYNREFDKRNFRRKIKKKDIVEDTGEKTEGVSHRPAKLYRRGRDLGEIVEIL